MKNKLLKIINSYGVDHQQRKLSEEIFELQEAITIRKQEKDDFSSYTDKLDEHIEEEIADCLVLMYQMIMYYNLNEHNIKKTMSEKVERQIRRMKEEGFDVRDLLPELCEPKEQIEPLEEINNRLLKENKRLKEQNAIITKENIQLKEANKLKTKEIMKLVIGNSK